MTFDQKLTWEHHIKNLILSCQKGLNLLKILSNKSWGADTTVLLKIYRSIIRSKIDYGCIAYNSATNTILKKLDTVQNSALRISLGAYRTSPIGSLQCEASEPPLSKRRAYLSISYATKIAINRRNPVYNNTFSNRYAQSFRQKSRAHTTFYERINRYQEHYQVNFPNFFKPDPAPVPPWTIDSPEINTSLSIFNKNDTNHSLIKVRFQSILSNLQGYETIYTDASKTENGVAAAVVTRNETLKFKMPQYSSTFTGELYAILEALNYILQNKCPQVAIISDSLSAILAIKPIFSQNPIIQRIKKVLHNIKSLKNKVVIVWVPSHIGIPGNELADKTARSAITDPDSKAIKKSVTYDFGTFIKRKVLSTWQNEWSNSGSKLLEIKPSINPWQYWPSSRKSQVILCRLRIGHINNIYIYYSKILQDIEFVKI